VAVGLSQMKIATIVALTFLFTQASASNGVIEGRVVHAGTREPISDVLITLVAPVPANSAANLAPDAAARLGGQNAIENAQRGAASGSQKTVMTDASGHFSFRDLAPGNYTVRAEKDGYFAQPLNGAASTAVSKTIPVQEGQQVAPQDLLMVKGAVISGRVRDPNGQPISGMNVSAYRVTYNNGRKMWTATGSKVTDDLGDYRIYWLYPGDYYVGVTPRAPAAIPGPQDSWARTFFPSETEPASAMVIPIKDGSDVTGTDINIRIAPGGTFKISGVAVNTTARPNPTTGAVDRSIASFALSPRDPGVLDAINPPTAVNAIPVASRPNGEFELRNIRAGSYDLYAVAPVLTDPAPPGVASIGTIAANVQITGGGAVPAMRRQPTSRTPVDVNRDVTDLRISVSAGVPLSGEVIANGGDQSIKPESIRLNLRNLDTMPQAFVSIIGAIPVDAAGKFAVQNVPEARYTIQMSGLPGSAYVADIRQGGASVMDNGFVLDSAATPVQVVIGANGATVQGTVQNAEGKPAVNATVVIVPPPTRRQNALLYRNATTGENGTFTLRGVPPGQYTIFAWESVPPTAWQNAEFLARYDGRGRPLNVAATSVSDVQLSVIPSDDRRN